MIRLVLRVLKHAGRTLLYGLVGGLIVLIVGAVLQLDSRPDLKVWHTADLDSEFTAASPVASFADYVALEDRLFRQLAEEVQDQIQPEDERAINRFHRGSLADPDRWPTNWNRSFELHVTNPSIGVLLIHGMSDSPYSMRSLGQRLHDEGAQVVGLRVPGHGTAPSGLVSVHWEDMAAAVRLAVRHLREQVGDRPLLIVGYSNGGALAVYYTLEALQDARMPLPARIILLSPEIGITKLAALASWQERLGHLLGLKKLAWNSILPEYDPYKYGSFALNAGKQAYLLTAEIQSRMEKLGSSGELQRFPPTLAFQSAVDATVSAPALVTGLFDRLPRGGHEIVIFDINRFTEIEPILKRDPGSWLDAMLGHDGRSFTTTVVSNESGETRAVAVHQRRPDETEITVSELGLAWPRGLYSLAHIALPFPPDDPVYGGPDAAESPGIQLGKLALRGERGVLQISAADMLRLRWNPFHSYIERRVVEVVQGLESASP